jgi:tRNA threonylcarbamoyladenosine biosynthesis protein TsaE
MEFQASTETSDSVARTEAIAAGLAAGFRGGEVVALHGDLGAGKTQFVRGLLRGLGGDPRAVSSPTFVLLNVYDSGRLTLYHLDAYRVHGAEDFEAIGFAELLEQGGVVAVEWPERVEALLPKRVWHVRLTPVDENRREIEISPPAENGPTPG